MKQFKCVRCREGEGGGREGGISKQRDVAMIQGETQIFYGISTVNARFIGKAYSFMVWHIYHYEKLVQFYAVSNSMKYRFRVSRSEVFINNRKFVEKLCCN